MTCLARENREAFRPSYAAEFRSAYRGCDLLGPYTTWHAMLVTTTREAPAPSKTGQHR